MSEQTLTSDKGKNLLRFLKDSATLRRQRIPAYRTTDKILWFLDIPKDQSECRSPFHSSDLAKTSEYWLEVHKTKMPVRPPVPEIVADWVRPEDLEQPYNEPELLPEITVIVEKEVSDPDTSPEHQRMITKKFSENRRLQNHPNVEDAWLEYLVEQWEPWAKKMQRWQEAHKIYEDVDFMRRRLEESEERYELVLAVGLLCWRDSTGTTIKRHLLTAPAEIEFDAARGILTVVPAATFESFKVEIDMLEFQDQPMLDNSIIQAKLEDLDIRAWDSEKVGKILREIANRTKGDAQVDEKCFNHREPIDEIFRVYFAPALILRERRPTAFEELIDRFLQEAEKVKEGTLRTTEPWERFLAEGLSSTRIRSVKVGDKNISEKVVGRIYFPLPTNEEQRQIIYRLNGSACVVVKGPPGTGKSHTIANLMSHLLASGERILVTAQAPKALTVLRGMLPVDLQALCVTSLGSSREDQRLLEEGVRGILRRQNEWQGPDGVQVEIDRLEKELEALEEELARTDCQIRESREAETHKHRLQGEYEGTAARIAQRIEQEQDTFIWFPDILKDQPPFPLKKEELYILAEMQSKLTPEFEEELRLDTGDFELPAPEDFVKLLEQLRETEREAQQRLAKASSRKREQLRVIKTDDDLRRLSEAVRKLEQYAVRAERVIGTLSGEIFKDLLAGLNDRWQGLKEQINEVIREFDDFLYAIGNSQVSLSDGVDYSRLLTDVERRLHHFENGGRRGFLLFKPRIVRETQYIEKICSIDGVSPNDIEHLRKLVAYLRLMRRVDDFRRLWPGPLSKSNQTPIQQAKMAKELSCELNQLLLGFEEIESQIASCIPVAVRADLAQLEGRNGWLSAIDAEIAVREKEKAHERLNVYLSQINLLNNCHPLLNRLSEAIKKRDPVIWRQAWEERESVRANKERLAQYKKLLEKLIGECPLLVKKLRENQGNPEWKPRILELEKAWFWASARGWLEQVQDRDRYESLVSKSHRLRRKIEETTERIAVLRAWKSFFERLDEATIQNLKAWTKAVARIGKGLGKYAYRHRRTARQYLMECIPKIPAWIMPLHKLYETIKAEPGLFDTVIIDEASQAGLDALVLFLLAKRIIVVGDDKQNSPEAVGVREDDIARLARQHLTIFRFREEFRPDTSLFDHAERAFGNLISLREHFRCVPEIIRFSNDLCYTDAPLIPLRQAPPDRLPPLRSTYVPEGQCEGQDQRIINRAEAEKLVEEIVKCIKDEAYEGKTIGAIVLQGHAQAQLIEKILSDKLEPRIVQERKLRCGIPSTFQGDQRDVIFLSMVIAPNVQYRALNRLPDQRRFNVAVSRARDQVWLFHSVQQSELNPEDLRFRLLTFIQNPIQEKILKLEEERDRLERACRRSPRQRGEQPDPYESWFEVDVALELLRQKYRIRPQYEVAGKRIDIVVEGTENRLAIECDGEIWHGPEHYERDMARQRQLERAGWTFVRIRESEFYANRNKAIEEILMACKDLGIQPADYSVVDMLQEDSTHDEKQIPVCEAVESKSTTTGSIVTNDSSSLVSEQGPFSGYSPVLSFPDPRYASLMSVRAALHRIIEKDGPLTRASVYRLYVEGCPDLQKVGKTVRQSLNRALGAMLRSGDIIQEDELYNGTPESQVLRIAGSPRVRERPAGRRDLLEIPPSELMVVLERLDDAGSENVLDDETIFRRLLEYYGFTRLTLVRRRYLAKILKLYRSKQRNRG